MKSNLIFLFVISLLGAWNAHAATPLTEFPEGFTYHGESGGLYGNGKNNPPDDLVVRATAAAKEVQPRNATGEPDVKGRIGLLVIGMSNTNQKATAWKSLLATSPANPSPLTIVNGAVGGMDASDWANPSKRLRQEDPSPWDQLDTRLKMENVTAAQVQVIWLHQALRRPSRFGEYPGAVDALEKELHAIIAQIPAKFPNVRLVFVSSRAYAGYAKSELNPEPYSYESAFAVRRVVLAAKAKSPVLMWGPYLWANGETPRTDGLKWEQKDFMENDGTHLSPLGARKAANLIDAFFRSSPFTSEWYSNKSKP